MEQQINEQTASKAHTVATEESNGENKVEVFNEWLSQAEKEALDALKADYAALKEFKSNYDAAELKAQKDAILEREEYSVLVDNEEFKALVTDAEKFSVEEIESKAKAIFADHVIKTGTFSVNKDNKKKPDFVGYNFGKKDDEEGPYGNLFKKK
jgi:hypothetical protein